jgi:hypothetical protein
MLHVGKLSYGLSRTFFDSQRLIARMAEMNVEQTVLSPATPFVNFDVSASLERESAELYNDEIGALRKATPGRTRHAVSSRRARSVGIVRRSFQGATQELAEKSLHYNAAAFMTSGGDGPVW